MSALVVDISAWIHFFAGETLPALENALQEARVILSPVVLAELMSGVPPGTRKTQLLDFLDGLLLYPTDRAHWLAVGELRHTLLQHKLKVSTPDAHIAQCALELKAGLLSFDSIFHKIAKFLPLHLAS